MSDYSDQSFIIYIKVSVSQNYQLCVTTKHNKNSVRYSWCEANARFPPTVSIMCKLYPDLPFVPIYRAFFRSPKLHGKSVCDFTTNRRDQ